jgi:uncharacterized protein YjbI with pentapeptide repeats
MANYFLQQHYDRVSYGSESLNMMEFENCTFSHCDFSQSCFIGVTFIDCTFEDCIFTGAKINHVAFRTVHFIRCDIGEVNFAMCDRTIFEVHFTGCRLDFSKFYALRMKAMTFSGCSMIAVDFMKTDLTSAVFANCDLYKTVFADTVLAKADFRTSFNYTLDPEKNRMKKALFSLEGAKGLLAKHELIFS